MYSPAQLNILLVEDDDADAMAVQRGFRKAKVESNIRRAHDGIEALDTLRGTNGQTKMLTPNIVIADINMPRMNGIEFLQLLRSDSELRSAVVFLLTTSSRDEDKAAAYSLNVAGYILKATAGRDFLDLVNLMELYRRLIELP